MLRMIIRTASLALVAGMLVPSATIAAMLAVNSSVGNSSADDGVLRTVALTGQPAPGIEGDVAYGGFFPNGKYFALNNSGEVLFNAGVAGSGVGDSNSSGLWIKDRTGASRLIARAGDMAPGIGNSNVFSSNDSLHLTLGKSRLNSSGHFVLSAAIAGPGVDSTNDQGIWVDRSGKGLELLVQEGSLAPGTDASSRFGGLGFLTKIADDGAIIFSAGLTGPTVDGTNSFGLWRGRNENELELIFRSGQPAPDVLGATISRPVGIAGISVNNRGQLALRGRLSGNGVSEDNDLAIWSEDSSGSLSIVAREGDSAAGINDGIFDTLSSPTLNGKGHTAFAATLTGAGIDTTNDRGIWKEANGNPLTLVARTGEAAPGVDSGVVFSFIGSQGGFSGIAEPVLNKLGQTAFHGFLVGSGIDSTNSSGIWSEGIGNGLSLVARAGESAPGTSDGVVFSSIQATTGLSLNNRGQTAFTAHLQGPDIDETNNLGIWAQDRFGKLKLIVRKGDWIDIDDGSGVDLRQIRTIIMASGKFENSPPTGFNDQGQVLFRAQFTDFTTHGLFVSDAVAVPEPSSLMLLLGSVLSSFLVSRSQAGKVSQM